MAQLAEAARMEAQRLVDDAHADVGQIADAAPADGEQLSARDIEAAAPPALPEIPPAEPDRQVELDAQVPESGAAVPGDADLVPEPAPQKAEEQTSQAAPQAFTPPPVSVEDLATVSTLPRLGILGRLRDR